MYSLKNNPNKKSAERKWRNRRYIWIVKLQNLICRISVPLFQKQPFTDVFKIGALNPKMAGVQSIWPPLWFFKNGIFWREGETLVFCDFSYYHKSHLSWKFHWNSSNRSEVMKNLSVIISHFHQFSSIFWIFLHFLLTNKLMTPVYKKRCHHFFTFNIFWIDFLTTL